MTDELTVYKVLEESRDNPDVSPEAPATEGSWTWWRTGPHPQGVWQAMDWRQEGWQKAYQANLKEHPWQPQDSALGPPSDFGSRFCHSCDGMSEGYPEPAHHTVCDGLCKQPHCHYHVRSNALLTMERWVEVDHYYDGYLGGYYKEDGQLYKFLMAENSELYGGDRVYDVWKVNEMLPDDAPDEDYFDRTAPVDLQVTETYLHEIPILPDSWIDKLRKRTEKHTRS